jgi:predicted ATPase
VAALAFRIFNAAPQVHILATSREALQVEGEFIYRLDPLAYPPDDERVTAAVARAFPATELFIERATASGARLEFSDAEAGTVSSTTAWRSQSSWRPGESRHTGSKTSLRFSTNT